MLTFFKAGKIFENPKRNTAVYRVTVLTELLNVVIPHFIDYPLLTKKNAVFEVWREAILLFEKKEHLTEVGFNKILSIYAAIGRGISNTVKEHFPLIKAIALPDQSSTLHSNKEALNSKNLNSWWLCGYLTLYCNFEAYVTAAGWKNNIYSKLRYRLDISRDISDLNIMIVIADYFNTEIIYRSNGKRLDINIANLEGVLGVVRFFNKYPLQSSKHDQFLIWRDFVLLANSKTRLGAKNAPIEQTINLFLELSEKFNKVKKGED